MKIEKGRDGEGKIEIIRKKERSQRWKRKEQ